MEKRLNILNETYKKMKHMSFNVIDKFTHIHGNHRNRPLIIK